MSRMLLCVSISIVCVYPSNVGAQARDRLGNPAIAVNLSHPPSLGLQAKRIAFGPASGPCSDQLIDMLVEDFVKNNVEVIDRQHLNTLLAEHNFTVSGYVDQKSTAELGKILGPAALVFTKVQRCASEKKSLYEDRKRGGTLLRRIQEQDLPPVVRVNISRTQFFFRGSVQTVDLATGRIFTATTIENSPSRRNESEDGIPEFPSEFEVQDISLREAVGSIHRLFFPWRETKNLLFFDDKDCNLKQAYQMVKAGNTEAALRLSEQNLEQCRTRPKVEPKTLGHAYYNSGMSHYIAGDYQKALDYLREAQRLRPGDIVTEAIAWSSRAATNAAEIQRIEQQVAVEATENNQREQQRQAETAAKRPKVLSVQEILAMRQAGLSDDLIATAIRKNNRAFDLTIEEMLELKRKGISEDLIKLMLDPSAPPPVPKRPGS